MVAVDHLLQAILERYKTCQSKYLITEFNDECYVGQVHVRTHTGERPYKCTHPMCDKAFASATNYKNHIRIHSGEKPYVCSIESCGRRFTEYSSLYKHHLVSFLSLILSILIYILIYYLLFILKIQMHWLNIFM